MSTIPNPVELPGLNVTLDRLVYRNASDVSPDRPHCFIYFLSIHNQSPLPVTLKGRKWVVEHDDGTTLVVEGDGVVGQFPCLDPGAHFSYNSYHVIGSDSVAEGAFFGVTEKGARVFTRIPRFEMQAPTPAA